MTRPIALLASFLVVPCGGPLAQQAQSPMDMPQMAAPDAQLVTTCVQSQQQAAAVADQIRHRIDTARQTNNPVEMRAALDDLLIALGQMRASLLRCDPLQAASAAMAADAHAGHVMPMAAPRAAGTPGMRQTPAQQAGQPAPQTVSPTEPPPTQPSDPHAGHAMPAEAAGELIKDPRCRTNVDPKTSPQATYNGRTYYFCSERDRQLFVADPARYLQGTTRPSPKPPAAADPHAGHGMPAKPAPQSTAPRGKPAPSADPHAGHAMPAAKPAPKTAPAEKPGAPPRAPAADPHAGHTPSSPQESREASAVDPVCGLRVDPATAPKATTGGRTYYFCSALHQQLFTKNPGKYLPKGR